MKRLLPALFGLASFVALVFPALDPAQQLFYRDTGMLYYPLKKYIADRLTHGQLPLWDPWTEAGVSLLGQMSPGLLHPWTALYLLFPFDLAFKLNHLLPLLLAGAGTYLLARRLGASAGAALCGAVAYGGCGYLVSQASANLIFVVGPAGVPLAVERFLAYLERPTTGRLAAASTLLALAAYGGEPQSMLFAGLIGAAWAIARPLFSRFSRATAGARGPATPTLRGVLSGARDAVLWAAVALLLSAPVALPAALQLARSNRAEGLSAEEKLRFFVPPQRLAGLFLSGAFDDSPEVSAASIAESWRTTPFSEYFAGGDMLGFATSLYLGAPVLLLALFARGRRACFLALGALVLILAAGGEELGLQPLLSRLIPGWALFRYTEKLMGPASLLLALLAALGAQAAFSARRRSLYLAATAGAAGIGFFMAAAIARRHAAAIAQALLPFGVVHDPGAAQDFVHQLIASLQHEAPLCALLAAVALGAALRPALPGAALAAAICAVTLVLGTGPLLSTLPVEHFHQPPPVAIELLARAGPSPGAWRLYVAPEFIPHVRELDPKTYGASGGRASLRPQYNALYGIESVSDYFSASDPHYRAIARLAAPSLFPLLGVRFALVMPLALSKAAAEEFGFVRSSYGMWLRELPILPRALVMDRAFVAASPADAAARLQAAGTDPSREAVLLPQDAATLSRIRPSSGSPGRARLYRPSPESLSVQVSAVTGSLLEIGEHFDPGWRATLDGAPVPVVEVDYALLGVPVPAGRHRVELRFWPRGLTTGLLCATLAFLLLGVTRPVETLTRFVSRHPASPQGASAA